MVESVCQGKPLVEVPPGLVARRCHGERTIPKVLEQGGRFTGIALCRLRESGKLEPSLEGVIRLVFHDGERTFGRRFCRVGAVRGHHDRDTERAPEYH
jgi:hypothetical protein